VVFNTPKGASKRPLRGSSINRRELFLKTYPQPGSQNWGGVLKNKEEALFKIIWGKKAFKKKPPRDPVEDLEIVPDYPLKLLQVSLCPIPLGVNKLPKGHE